MIAAVKIRGVKSLFMMMMSQGQITHCLNIPDIDKHRCCLSMPKAVLVLQEVVFLGDMPKATKVLLSSDV